MNVPELLVAIVAAMAAASLAILFIRDKPSEKQRRAPSRPTLLFENGVLHHACDAAQSLFDLEPGTDEWEDLRERIIHHVPDFPERNGATTAPFENGRVAIRKLGSRTQVQFQDMETSRLPLGLSKDEENELHTLRRIQASVTHPVWQADHKGNVIWANDTYKALSRKITGVTAMLEDPLFGQLTPQDIPDGGLRISLSNAESSAVDWFRVVATETPTGAIYNATNLNAVVFAEEAQRNFVQTLAKTFAHLSTGLAIFDRNRQLMLFNPALIDLTNLSAEFLSATPSIESFFDKLRENRRMPEPKNYRNWRHEITEVIAAANDGRYQETWSLENGQTFKVSGRPHPEGATAFLIEDISAEISETQNSRAELQLAQCLLDRVGDGMAVFSRGGVLIFCNEAYRSLWNIDPKTSFADFTVSDSIGIWSGSCAPNPMWQDIEDFVLGYGDRKTWDMPIRPLGQSLLRCEISPIISGATLVRFCRSADKAAQTAASAPASRSE